ncbi:MAG: choice-of-anchor K domain-containing protein [Micrococcales bacterium]|nr:choice-of-anchor K domain-containing protein [Micrococcales bacterium]
MRFDPPDTSTNPPDKTLWVNNPNEAAAGHGRPCSDDLNRSNQSAIGITPTAETSTDTGVSFLLGTMKHYNNPINTDEPQNDTHFIGDLKIELKNTAFAFPYDLWETNNGCTDEVDPEQKNCADDILKFTDTPTGELTIDGYPFALVSSGFTEPSFTDPKDPKTAFCPARPVGKAKTKFITTEGTTTTGCLYGKLAQKRPVKLVKKVVWDQGVTAPTSTTDFPFTSTSDLVGSPWKTSPGNLTPPKTNGGTAEYQKPIRAGSETVTITEGTSPANWQFQDVKCVDGAGQVVQGGDNQWQDRHARKRPRCNQPGFPGNHVHLHQQVHSPGHQRGEDRQQVGGQARRPGEVHLRGDQHRHIAFEQREPGR